MDAQDIRNLQEAYVDVYEATGRDEMLAANIARARAPKSTTGGTVRTPSGPVKTPTPGPGPVTQAPKPSTTPTTTPKPSGGVLGKVDSTLRDVAGRVGGEIGARQGRERMGNLPILGDIGGAVGRNRGTQRGQQMYDKAKETVGGLLKQDYEYDMFDVVLEHLVAEGYADTNESALVIMANMSEEWRESIVEATVLAAKGGVAGAVQVKQTKTPGFLGTGIGSRTVSTPVPGTFTRNTPGRQASGPRSFDASGSGSKGAEAEMSDRSGPTDAERNRYNAAVTKNNTVGDKSVEPSPRAVNQRANQKGHSGLMPTRGGNRDRTDTTTTRYEKPNQSWRGY
jgi:hypothetical protein